MSSKQSNANNAIIGLERAIKNFHIVVLAKLELKFNPQTQTQHARRNLETTL
jgi:hypothetical protein